MDPTADYSSIKTEKDPFRTPSVSSVHREEPSLDLEPGRESPVHTDKPTEPELPVPARNTGQTREEARHGDNERRSQSRGRDRHRDRDSHRAKDRDRDCHRNPHARNRRAHPALSQTELRKSLIERFDARDTGRDADVDRSDPDDGISRFANQCTIDLRAGEVAIIDGDVELDEVITIRRWHWRSHERAVEEDEEDESSSSISKGSRQQSPEPIASDAGVPGRRGHQIWTQRVEDPGLDHLVQDNNGSSSRPGFLSYLWGILFGWELQQGRSRNQHRHHPRHPACECDYCVWKREKPFHRRKIE